MGQERTNESALEGLEELEARRHRPVTEVRLPARDSYPSAPRVWTMADELRGGLWAAAQTVLFERGRPTAVLRRAWSVPPVGGLPDRIPEDVDRVLEGWFTLVEPADVYRFLEAVLDGLEPIHQPRFAAMINAVLERGDAGHRFVLRRLVPITSRSDIAAVERALAACRAAHWVDVEGSLFDAIAYLAEKPESNALGAIRAVTRAVQEAAEALTHEEYVDFEDALHGLEAKGHVERALVAAYAGLMTHVNNTARRTAPDDARLIVVMCSGFVSQLAARAG